MKTKDTIKTTAAVQRIRSNLLRNEEWFQFHTEIREVINNSISGGHASALNIAVLFDLYNTKYSEADTAILLLRKSPITEKIDSAHFTRNQYFRGFSDVIAGLTRHGDSAKSDAALRVQALITHYGNITRQSYDSSTAALYNFVQDLRTTYHFDLQLLQVTDWVDQLAEANQVFESLMQTRYKEKDAQTVLRMKSVRAQMDKVFRLMLDQLDINVVAYDQPMRDVITVYIHALNNRIARYRNTLLQRAGRWTAQSGAMQNEAPTDIAQAA